MNDIEKMALIQQLEGNATCYELLGEKELPRLLRRASAALTPPEGYVLVPVEATAAMVEAAVEAYMPFGDMELALQMGIAARREVSP